MKSIPFSRRGMLRSIVGSSLVLPGMISQLLAAEERRPSSTGPLAPKKPHFPAKAKRVIFLFSSGGVSHMDAYDYKPKLFQADGKMLGVGGGLALDRRPLLKPRWDFRPGGKCGTMVSDLFPHIRERMDDICLIRSMTTDNNEHFQSTLAVHTGSFSFARPSLGAWLSYGLGTPNQNLPSFVVISPYAPFAGAQLWANDFLPAHHQGTLVAPGKDPIPNVGRQSATAELQEMELGLAEAFNGVHLRHNGNDRELAARIKTFETAFQMQFEAPEAFDLSQETPESLNLYGLESGDSESFGWQCLVARRLAERGVRFIELIDSGASKNWDSHGDMNEHMPLAKKVDQPIAGLIHDLKRRGMLDETLVVWTTEFGRTPATDGPKGRGHHPAVYSSWLAGGSVKGGMVYGESDEIGATVGRDKVHLHDFHATILHLLGIDHEKLTYRHAGRDFRLTDVHGVVVRGILA
jgi:hypothetical protein